MAAKSQISCLSKISSNRSILPRFRDKHVFVFNAENSRWPPKVAGKRFFWKIASRLYRYPVGQKFCQNRSISLHFQDKRVFVFIQDGCQKWQENDFCEKLPVDSAIPCGSKIASKIASISLRFRDKRVFAFNTEIQDGRQKWWEKDFCKKSPVDSSYTLFVKNFVEISLHF